MAESVDPIIADLAKAVRGSREALDRGLHLLALAPAGTPRGPGSGQTFTEAKLLFIRSNSWEVAWGGRRERLIAGDLLTVAPGTTHRERVPTGKTQVVNVLTAEDDLVVTSAHVVAPFAVQIRGERRLLAADGRLIRQLVIVLADAARPAVLHGSARRLLMELLMAAVGRPAGTQQGGDFLAASCRRLIEERHSDPGCTATVLAKSLDVHPGSLSRAFSRATGGTVIAALMARRILAAQELLSAGTLPVAEVARRCGFHRRDVFTRAFRAATDRSPSQWRRLGFLHEDVLRKMPAATSTKKRPEA